jgi:hypothetical protein
MKLKKIGAVLLGAALLGATLCAVQADVYPPPKEFFVNPDGTPACIITVGSEAAAMDVVSASMLAAKIGTMAVRVEEVQLPPKRYTSTHQDIPLYDWLPLPVPDDLFLGEMLGYPVLDVPEATPYNAWDFNPGYAPTLSPRTLPPINYTLSSLWYFDDYNWGNWGNQNGIFDPWETHEEIQYRFDNLAVFDPASGLLVRDYLADLLGGDVNLWKNPPPATLDLSNMLIPSLIYRADNIFLPPMILCIQTKNHPSGTLIVDLDYELAVQYYVPEPWFVVNDALPKFMFFGTLYTVVDYGAVYDYNLRTGETGDLANTPYLVAGTPSFYYEEYLYKDQPEEYGDYTVLLKDVDVDHNKAWFEITDPDGTAYSFWMVLDPEHGFSPNLQQQGWSGVPYAYPPGCLEDDQRECEYYNKWIVGRAENDVWGDLQIESYTDDTGDIWYLFEVPMFVIDGVKVFVGANGTTGIEVKVYTLQDKDVFYNHLCCVPFVTEPNNYQLFLDAYQSGWDRLSDPDMFGADGAPGFIGVDDDGDGTVDELDEYLWAGSDDTIPPTGDELWQYQPPGTGWFPPIGLGFWNVSVLPGQFIANGFLDNNDGHIGYEYYTYWPNEFFPEQFDLDRDGIPGIGWPDNDSDLFTFPYPQPDDVDGDGLLDRILSGWPDIEDPGWFDSNADTFYDVGALLQICGEPGWPIIELDIALCDTVEMAECLTRFVFSGPLDYFRIEMDDITWDDDQDANPDPWDGVTNDGLDWKTVMETPSGTYTQIVQVDIDETELVKLDIEIDSLDKQNFNLILIGGPVANQLSKELEDLSIPPDDGSPVDWTYTSLEGDFKLYTDPYGTGKDVLMVAGADRDATRAAAERLISKL